MSNSVVIIDDDPAHVNLLSEVIEHYGNKVSGVGYNGKDAVELSHRLKPNIVFLDIMMPDNDGFYAIDQIKKNDSDTRIVAITGDDTEKTLTKLQDNEISVIYKPFELDSIEKALKTTLA